MISYLSNPRCDISIILFYPSSFKKQIKKIEFEELQGNLIKKKDLWKKNYKNKKFKNNYFVFGSMFEFDK